MSVVFFDSDLYGSTALSNVNPPASRIVMTRYLRDIHKQGTLFYDVLVKIFCLRNC
jgi:hypothetical protein